MKRLLGLLTLLALLTTGRAWAVAPIMLPNLSVNTEAFTANIATATTTLVVSGSTTPIYVWYLGIESSGSNTAAFFQFETGTGATCGTNTALVTPVAQSSPATAAGLFTSTYAGSATLNGDAGITPAGTPLVIQAGVNICVVTSGTTPALYGIALYSTQP